MNRFDLERDINKLTYEIEGYRKAIDIDLNIIKIATKYNDKHEILRRRNNLQRLYHELHILQIKKYELNQRRASLIYVNENGSKSRI